MTVDEDQATAPSLVNLPFRDMGTVQVFEGTSGDIHFRSTGRRLGRFAYRLVISHADYDSPAQMTITVAFRRVALRRVLVRQAVGGDDTLTLTLADGRRVDLFVHYRAGRFVKVTVESGLYSVPRHESLPRVRTQADSIDGPAA
jgi:hypothetical protein